MTVLHAFLYGFTATLRQKRVLFLLYLSNLGFGLLLLLPLLPILHGTLGHSLSADGMEALLDIGIISDLLRTHAGKAGTYHQIASISFLAYLLVSTFLTGGLLDLLASPGRDRGWSTRFFGGCRRYFSRFARLLGFHLGSLILIAGGNHLLNLFLLFLFEDSTHEIGATLAMASKQVVLLLLLVLVAALFDFARILTILHNRRNMLATLASAASFVLHNLRAVFLIRLTILASAGGIFLLYWVVARWILPDSAWLSLLVLQQLFILFRHFLKILQYASELNLCRGLEISEDAQLLSRVTSREAMQSALS